MRSIIGDFLAIDRKARAKTPSIGISTRSVEVRICDFNDVVVWCLFSSGRRYHFQHKRDNWC